MIIKRADAVLLAILALVVLVVPFTLGDYWVLTFGSVGAITLAVIGLNVAMGWAGLLSFGQPVFMALGGYASAILATRYSVNPWLALLGGIILLRGGGRGHRVPRTQAGKPLLRRGDVRDEPDRAVRRQRGAGLHRRRDRHHRDTAAHHRVGQLRRPRALLHPGVGARRPRAARDVRGAGLAHRARVPGARHPAGRGRQPRHRRPPLPGDRLRHLGRARVGRRVADRRVQHVRLTRTTSTATSASSSSRCCSSAASAPPPGPSSAPPS